MTRFPGLRRFMRVERDRAGVERAVDDEIGFHFEMSVKELVAEGMSDDDARREALRRFGDLERTRARLALIDRSRIDQQRRTEWWSAFTQDLRYALRGIRLKPGFAFGVVLTLGLGIGANAAMFGIVDRLLFRPPAYLTAPDRTHHIYFRRMLDGKEFVGGSAQYQRLLDLTRESKSMDVLAGYAQGAPAVGVGEAARERDIGAMSASMWTLFSARPALGRFFTADEDQYPTISRVVVLSYGYWQSQYAGARDVIGKRIDIGPSQYTVIGVAPRGFAAVEIATPTMFVPLTAWAADGFGSMWGRLYNTYNITWIKIYGRRKPGVSLDAATADLTLAYRRSYEHQISIQPRTASIEIVQPHALVASVLDERGPSRSADANVATLLLGVACVVLLIACANVGNLLLGRALKRRREIAVRLALGVSRTRLTIQLVIESVLLAAMGGAAGVAVAQWGGAIVRATLLPQVDWGNTLADTRVLAFTAIAALLTGLLTGLAPIVQAGRYNVASELKAGPREGGGHRSSLRTALIVFQAALSVVLLVGAGLFVRSIQRIRTIDLGYDAERILWVEPHLRSVKLDSARKAALNQALIDRARREPAVDNATIVLSVPFSSSYNDDVFVPGIDTAKIRGLGEILLQGASPGYFATLGTRILQGRAFGESDRSGTALVAIVSEALARALWPGESAIGKCVKLSADTMPCRTVVGVSANVRFGSLGGESASLVLHVPASQFTANNGTIFVRTRGSAESQREALRRALQTVMPGAAYVTTRPLSSVLERVTRSWRLGAALFTVFGGLALVLAAIGLYSVIAYSVTQRTHEMGVRIALGAQAREVVAMVVRDGLRVVAIGVAIGAVIAVSTARWIAPLLFQVSPRDPLVYGIVAVTLAVVALIAGWLPARRASRVDPATALRAD